MTADQELKRELIKEFILFNVTDRPHVAVLKECLEPYLHLSFGQAIDALYAKIEAGDLSLSKGVG